jgi:hypothetical protein
MSPSRTGPCNVVGKKEEEGRREITVVVLVVREERTFCRHKQ